MQEELQRRRERAARFHTEDTLADYQPAVDLEKEQRRRARAKKFGTTYEPTDETGLAHAGAQVHDEVAGEAYEYPCV